MGNPRTIILGDSHVIAVAGALGGANDVTGDDVFISRFTKVRQDGRVIEGIDEQTALAMVARTRADVRVVSLIGGNRFNTFGMMQHPERFDFVDPEDADAELDPEARIVSLGMIERSFDEFARRHDGIRLKALADASVAPVYHCDAPPPKRDNAFIEGHAETFFRDAGIDRLGASSPALRRKLWLVQGRSLRRYCDEIGVTFIPAPREAMDADGFLKPDLYGRDATHANSGYGALVLAQIAALQPEAVR